MRATFWACEGGGWAAGVWGPRVLTNTMEEAREVAIAINEGVEVEEENRR